MQHKACNSECVSVKEYDLIMNGTQYSHIRFDINREQTEPFSCTEGLISGIFEGPPVAYVESTRSAKTPRASPPTKASHGVVCSFPRFIARSHFRIASGVQGHCLQLQLSQNSLNVSRKIKIVSDTCEFLSDFPMRLLLAWGTTGHFGTVQRSHVVRLRRLHILIQVLH
jgi:hypothetical protein